MSTHPNTAETTRQNYSKPPSYNSNSTITSNKAEKEKNKEKSFEKNIKVNVPYASTDCHGALRPHHGQPCTGITYPSSIQPNSSLKKKKHIPRVYAIK